MSGFLRGISRGRCSVPHARRRRLGGARDPPASPSWTRARPRREGGERSSGSPCAQTTLLRASSGTERRRLQRPLHGRRPRAPAEWGAPRSASRSHTGKPGLQGRAQVSARGPRPLRPAEAGTKPPPRAARGPAGPGSAQSPRPRALRGVPAGVARHTRARTHTHTHTRPAAARGPLSLLLFVHIVIDMARVSGQDGESWPDLRTAGDCGTRGEERCPGQDWTTAAGKGIGALLGDESGPP